MTGLEIKSLREIIGEGYGRLDTDAISPTGVNIFPERRLVLPPPAFQKGPVQTGEFANMLPAVEIAYIPNAIVTPTGCVIAEDKYIVMETLEGEPQDNGIALADGTYVLPPESEVVKVDEDILSFSKFGVFNYCIFLTEILPAAFILMLQGRLGSLRYVLNFPRFMSPEAIKVRWDYLYATGYQEDRRLACEKPVRVKGVYVAKVGERYKNHRVNQILPMMAGHLKQRFCTPDQGLPRRIYVSRQKADSRRVQNYHEIEPLLQKHAITPVYLEHIPAVEQINLFAKAELVVSEHGAGLVNAMYMRPGATMVEIFPGKIVGRWAFRSISCLFRLRYVFGGFPVEEQWLYNRDHVVLPPEIMEGLLAYALS